MKGPEITRGRSEGQRAKVDGPADRKVSATRPSAENGSTKADTTQKGKAKDDGRKRGRSWRCGMM